MVVPSKNRHPPKNQHPSSPDSTSTGIFAISGSFFGHSHELSALSGKIDQAIRKWGKIHSLLLVKLDQAQADRTISGYSLMEQELGKISHCISSIRDILVAEDRDKPSLLKSFDENLDSTKKLFRAAMQRSPALKEIIGIPAVYNKGFKILATFSRLMHAKNFHFSEVVSNIDSLTSKLKNLYEDLANPASM